MSIFAASVAFPSTPFPPKDAADLRLAAAGAAVDKGLPITGINHGFSGAAPDLGAHEVGQALPVYGPRGNAGTGGTGGTSSSSVPPVGGTIAPMDGTATIATLAGTTAIVSTGGVVATGGVEGTDIAVPDAGVDAPTAQSGKGCSCSLASAPSHPLASALVMAMLLLRRRRRARKSD